MVVWIALLGAAWASDSASLDHAWQSYMDAELDDAARVIEAALATEYDPAQRAALLHLWAAVDLSRGHEADAQSRMRQALIADGATPPDPRLGPAVHTIWEDLRPAEVVPVALVEAPRNDFGASVPTDDRIDISPAPRRPSAASRTLMWTGALSLATGVTALAVGVGMEGRFKENPYLAASYAGCLASDPCYAGAREQAIQRDASIIQGVYAGGYALGGLGAAALTTSLVISPRVTSQVAGVNLRGSF